MTVAMRRIVVAGTVAVLALSVALLWLRGMRSKDSAVVDLQRRVNRAVFNPRTVRTAGQPGASTALLQHTGRRSGVSYRTPLGLIPTEDGFVVGLVYGRRSDWVRNVLASGSAVVVHDGRTCPVDRPEIVPVSAVAEHFSAADLNSFRLFGVTEALRLRRARD